MIIHLCQDESGAVHLQADDGPVWDLGDALNPDAYAVDAAAWVHGDWAPSEPLGWTTTTPDGLTRVASWSPETGLVLHVAPEHLGAAAQQYIGPLPGGPLPHDRADRAATLVREWRAANVAAGDDPALRADDEALRARYDDIEARYLPQIQALGYAVLMQGYHPCVTADKRAQSTVGSSSPATA